MPAGAQAPPPFAAQLGPRPFFLADDMSDGPLKAQLQGCAASTQVYWRSSFSTAHRGAPLQNAAPAK